MSSEITFQAGSGAEVFWLMLLLRAFFLMSSFCLSVFLMSDSFHSSFSLGLGCVLFAMHQEVICNEKTLIICASGRELLTEC